MIRTNNKRISNAETEDQKEQDKILKHKYQRKTMSQYLSKEIKISRHVKDIPLSHQSEIIRKTLRDQAEIMVRKNKNNNTLRMRQINLNETLHHANIRNFIAKHSVKKEQENTKIMRRSSNVFDFLTQKKQYKSALVQNLMRIRHRQFKRIDSFKIE